MKESGLSFLNSGATQEEVGGGELLLLLLNNWSQAHYIWYRVHYEYVYRFCVTYCLYMSTVINMVTVRNSELISDITYTICIYIILHKIKIKQYVGLDIHAKGTQNSSCLLVWHNNIPVWYTVAYCKK